MTRRSDQDWILVGFLALVSAGIRLTIVAGGPFPINDGGLFYAFTTDLLDNGLRLPSFASYNGAGIPLVYPPLAFYVTAVLHEVTGISVSHILQFVPAILSAVAIPAFFALAAKMMQSRQQAVLATVVFSLVPRSFDWLIMGGGITRSLGLLFFLLFFLQAFRLFAEQDQRAVLPAVLAGSLVVVSHPEASAHAAVAAGLLLGWHRRSRAGLLHALPVVLGIAILTSPWWLAIAVRHGPGPWLAGLAAADYDSYAPLLRLVALLRFDFTDEPFLRIFGVLGLLGLFVHIAKKEYFLPAWLMLMEVAEPRGGALFIMIPLAMAAGFFLDRVLFPALQRQEAQAGGRARRSLPTAEDERFGFPTSRLPFLVLIFLFLYGVLAAYYVGLNLQQNASLARRDLLALEWISSHTAPEDRFALVTQGEPLLDPTSDWFPAITGRRSVASYFGAEWIRGLDFARGLARYRALQACADQDAECLMEWQGSGNEPPVGYVYVRAPNPEQRTVLQQSLRLDAGFRLIYSEQGIDVFQWHVRGGD